MSSISSVNRIRIKEGKSIDFALFFITIGLVIFGVVMVFSASYYNSINEDGNPYYYFIRAGAWGIAGFVAMIITANIDYRIFKRFAKPIMITSVVLLLLLLTPLGVERNNAVRWIGVGGFTLMPGEIAKISAIIFVSWFFSRDPKLIKSLTKGIAPMILLCAVYGYLIIIQPNLSTAITVIAIIVGIMFMAGLNWFYLFSAAGAGIAGISALIAFNPESHWADRITGFLDPFADPLNTGYQIIQSLLALGSGGLMGLGLGKSIQKNLYLPEPHTDFILAIIGEELGLIGCLFLILGYIILIWRCVHISLNAPDLFGTLVASGMAIMIGIQVVLNIAVVTSSMPATGVSLPLVSYGGNSILIFMAGIGILLNISKNSQV